MSIESTLDKREREREREREIDMIEEKGNCVIKICFFLLPKKFVFSP
jgi:hypothetical protein